jgi:hypothetical protein
MVLVLVIGGCLGWIVRSARIQRDAVAVIKKAGGSVMYDWEWKDDQPIANAKPWAPQWLVNCLGVDYFGNVTHVSDAQYYTYAWSDTDLGALGRLNRLEVLSLGRSTVTDAGLARLEGLSHLRWLELRNWPQLSDAGLAHLKGLTGLRGILLYNSPKVSDAGLAHLKGLASLEALVLGKAPLVTDQGVAHLRGLTRLQSLKLDESQVSDASLVHLNGFTSLKKLFLNHTKLTDVGFEELEQALPNTRIYGYGEPSYSPFTALARLLRDLADFYFDFTSGPGVTVVTPPQGGDTPQVKVSGLVGKRPLGHSGARSGTER